MWPTHYIPNQERIEGIPPPEFYLTTPPYPIEIVEEMQASGGPYDIGFVPFASVQEAITTSGRPVSGSMSALLVTMNILPEEIQSAGIPISGVLKQILITIEIPNEMIISAGIPISGVLRDPLVVYDNWPLGFETEDLQSAGIPVSGALT